MVPRMPQMADDTVRLPETPTEGVGSPAGPAGHWAQEGSLLPPGFPPGPLRAGGSLGLCVRSSESSRLGPGVPQGGGCELSLTPNAHPAEGSGLREEAGLTAPSTQLSRGPREGTLGMRSSDKSAWGMATGREAQGIPPAEASGREFRTALTLPRVSFPTPRSRGRPRLNGRPGPHSGSLCRPPTRSRCARSTGASCCRPAVTRTCTTGCTPSTPCWPGPSGMAAHRGSPRPPEPAVGRREVASMSGLPGPAGDALKEAVGAGRGRGLLPPGPRGRRQRVLSPGRLGRQGCARNAPHTSLRAPMAP